ncbi:Shedu anti-phage system protein SduA domain-containing protein [Aerosakkonemataceae cyanobacterium BLCC-F50]|uniref:Shedu anti-phage system protein SduA domain-containing protein n=1 Tax=Floridaenema flaviceps BLCC-F50 TaxID=3153642 RepID=A0ABV4XYD2_9CYAN
MASEKHLSILQQGVKAWNRWRYENPKIKPNLRGADLHGSSLDGIDLSEADLREARLYDASLGETNFSKADLSKANLAESDLTEANLREARLIEAFIENACLNYADFHEANLTSADLCDTRQIGTNFSKAILEKANLSRAQSIRTDFTGAKFTGVCLEDWFPNRDIKLNEVECKYIYLHFTSSVKDPRKALFSKPFPENREFAEGEFSRLFQVERYYVDNGLTALEKSIIEFENLLTKNPKGHELLFHEFLKDHPSLLDVYGVAESEPQFTYPKNELSPTGKSRVEPDFIIRYPNHRYKLVELEKPGKQIETKQGHPTSLFTQAAWQLAEWEHYISNYPHLLQQKYPGISTHRSSMLVIGRRLEPKYMELLSKSVPHSEICTYDDLLDRANRALANLKALSL